jgi:hypothetical protein
MRNELQKKNLHIGFIQTTLLSGITSVITGQLKSLIMTAIKDRTGRFLKQQFRERATGILKEWMISQLRGKFMDYLIDFIVTYIENNMDKIFDNKTIAKVATTVIDKIINGLGTYLINPQ